ncbi:hypothetical protein Pmar_PMAR000152, partial [Perkinsus marinus ATCC 50983]
METGSALYDVKRAIGGARTGLAEKAGYTIVPKKRKNTSKKSKKMEKLFRGWAKHKVTKEEI